MKKVLFFLSCFLSFIVVFAQTFYLYPYYNKYEIKRVFKKVKPGDTIILKPGVYKKLPFFKKSGSIEKFIKIKSLDPTKTIIKGSFRVLGDFVEISNLNFIGNSKKLSYEEVIKQWWNPSRKINNSGLILCGKNIIVKKCLIGYYPAAGIKIIGNANRILVFNNVIFNNAWWSTGGTGGLVTRVNREKISNLRIDVIGNLFFGNESRIFSHVFSKGFAKLVIDEGEALLIQENEKIKDKLSNGRYLVKDNVFLFNGKGVNLNKTGMVDVIENCCYCNGTTLTGNLGGGIRANKVANCKFIRNFVVTCGKKIGFSINGKNNLVFENYLEGRLKKSIEGVLLIKKLFRNPSKLDFYNKIVGVKFNLLLNNLKKMLARINEKVKPTNYKVNYRRQILDILKTIPKNSKTKIILRKNEIYIYNIDNTAIKKLPSNFILKLKDNINFIEDIKKLIGK